MLLTQDIEALVIHVFEEEKIIQRTMTLFG
jgi:hypothetical protein